MHVLPHLNTADQTIFHLLTNSSTSKWGDGEDVQSFSKFSYIYTLSKCILPGDIASHFNLVIHIGQAWMTLFWIHLNYSWWMLSSSCLWNETQKRTWLNVLARDWDLISGFPTVWGSPSLVKIFFSFVQPDYTSS